MKKMYSDNENWSKSNWKQSFKNLANDGYSFSSIETQDWFLGKMDTWMVSVLVNTTAHKVIKETEKAIQFSVVNQYGNVYEMWFPKSALISY